MEDNAVGNGSEAAKLIKSTKNVNIGRSPGISAAARITGLGYPHLRAGHILIAHLSCRLSAIWSSVKILLGCDKMILPMNKMKTCRDSLGNAVVVMIAEYVHRLLCILEECIGADLAHKLLDGEFLDIELAHFSVKGARANSEALGIIIVKPLVEDILVANEVFGSISLRRARACKEIRLIHKLCRVDRNTVFTAEIEEELCLGGIPRLIRRVNSCAVRNRHKKLRANSLYKFKNSYPLLFCKNTLISFGRLTACFPFKIVICGCSPCSGNSNPSRTDLLGELSKARRSQINGGIFLHKRILVFDSDYGELSLAGNLIRSVCLPKRSACNLGHLYVVGNQSWINVSYCF